jgi:serine/threonine protein kinase
MGTDEALYSPQHSNTMFLVMECMEGSLQSVLDGMPVGALLEPITIKAVMVQLLRGVAHMHACGVIHRDIKPSNLLLKEGVLKLADFGLACLASDTKECRRVCGTLDFIAPEMLLSKTKPCAATTAVDVWATGCIMLELVMGKLPLPDHIQRPISHAFSSFSSELQAQLKLIAPPEYSDLLDIMHLMLCPEPSQRISARSALDHPCFILPLLPSPLSSTVSATLSPLPIPSISVLKEGFAVGQEHAVALEQHMNLC